MDFDVQKLEKDKSIIRAEIEALYRELDQRFHLNGASLGIEFKYDEEALGAYDREAKVFRFSLPFLAFSSAAQLSKEDRLDLYKHEYAHYMAHNLEIPNDYLWEPGVHGSAWKYCCSLVDCVPSPYYKAGESRKKVNYDKLLEKPKKLDYKQYSMLDRMRREKEDTARRASIAMFKEGDSVNHPTYGAGIVASVHKGLSGVQLDILFANPKIGRKRIDQKWLLRAMHKPQKTDR